LSRIPPRRASVAEEGNQVVYGQAFLERINEPIMARRGMPIEPA
jgi:hypothetical protein